MLGVFTNEFRRAQLPKLPLLLGIAAPRASALWLRPTDLRHQREYDLRITRRYELAVRGIETWKLYGSPDVRVLARRERCGFDSVQLLRLHGFDPWLGWLVSASLKTT